MKNACLPLIILACLSCVHCWPQGGLSAANDARIGHDPLRPYRATVLCIDTSLSPEAEQFKRLLGIMETIAATDVSYNDLVWLMEVQSVLRPAKIFAMPARTSHRSAGTAAEDELRESKVSLSTAIGKMSQLPGNTDLQSPLDAALNILRGHPQATAKLLVIGSDFLTDTGRGQVSVEPPQSMRPGSAANVNFLLLVTYPKPSYLAKLRMSYADLFMKIETKWSSYLKQQGASSVTVRLVDAIPVSRVSAR